jgi:hypothetical protein
MRSVTAALASLVLLVGCSSARGLRPSESLEDLPRVLELLQNADKVDLFEGLPHQSMEPALYNQERARTRTVEHDGFAFYETPIAVNGKTTADLLGFVTEAANYSTYPDGALKACGGFHPDWLIEAVHGAETAHLHICLGCEDFRVYEEGEMVLWCEIADVKSLAELLEPLRTNRPVSTVTAE